jgi:hypothetical protein
MTDTHRCAICTAEFSSSQDLIRHERADHAPQSASSSRERPVEKEQPRSGREFSRRNLE